MSSVGSRAIVKDDMLVIRAIIEMNSGMSNHSVNWISSDPTWISLAHLWDAPFCCLGMPYSRLLSGRVSNGCSVLVSNFLPNDSRRCLMNGATEPMATSQSSLVRLITLSIKAVLSGLHQGSIEHRKPGGTSGLALVIHRLPSIVTLRNPDSAPTPLNRRLNSRRRTVDSP